jgi:hypothetical protein
MLEVAIGGQAIEDCEEPPKGSKQRGLDRRLKLRATILRVRWVEASLKTPLVVQGP